MANYKIYDIKPTEPTVLGGAEGQEMENIRD